MGVRSLKCDARAITPRQSPKAMAQIQKLIETGEPREYPLYCDFLMSTVNDATPAIRTASTATTQYRKTAVSVPGAE